jgi:hypothetical protein
VDLQATGYRGARVWGGLAAVLVGGVVQVDVSEERGNDPGRKTRFRPLAKPYRTGLITRRVPVKGFRIASYASSPFPGFAWRKDIQVFYVLVFFLLAARLLE